MLLTVPPEAEEWPLHPEGKDWLHSINTGGGAAVVSDSATELVGYIVPGYGDLPHTDTGHDEALGLRYDFLVTAGNAAQAYYRSFAAEQGWWDPETAGEDILTALYADRSIPFEGLPDRVGVPAWDHRVPLILFITDYSPYVRRLPPEGRVVWLDPSTDVTFLQSLEKLNMIRAYGRPDPISGDGSPWFIDVTGRCF